MTRSGAPFHGAHGEGRTAISPAASQAGAEPCARAFPAARARRNAPVISDNAVVAAPMNWRAESTGMAKQNLAFFCPPGRNKTSLFFAPRPRIGFGFPTRAGNSDYHEPFF